MLSLLLATTMFNDGSGHMAAGGAVGLLHGQHPSIRLLDEKLNIELPSGKVHVEYVFRNEGRATTALMAFPEEGYMLPPKDRVRVKKGDSLFGYFHSWVDGKPIQVTRAKGIPTPGEDDGLYQHWWVKRVPFGAGQVRKVVNDYQGGLGWGPPWTPERSFSYTLHTGGTWKGGTIGKLAVRVDARDLAGKSPQTWSPDGWKSSGGVWTLNRENFKPEDDIAVRWPDGYYNFNVNGKDYMDLLYTATPPPPMKDSPFKLGDELYIPAQLAQPIIGGHVTIGNGSVVLERNGKAVPMSLGASPARILNGRHYVPLRYAVRKLGGDTWWEGGKLYVRI